ncbi:g10697 [Coccomyxa viridis]|uniref:G10697 protein n=1 Tax=Coccomyxa viridis TaxID=1274662 RepID=A0ABP1G6C1_9CHLO
MRLKCSQGRGSVGAGTASHLAIFFSQRLSSQARSGFTPNVGRLRSTASEHSVFAALRRRTCFSEFSQ